jgi:Tol biopolymer transport system component
MMKRLAFVILLFTARDSAGDIMKRIVIALALTAAVLAVACGGGGGGPSPAGPSGTIGPDSGIAFAGRDLTKPSSEVYLVDADSGAVQQLTNSEESEWWPIWSRDRQRLAFIAWLTPTTTPEATPVSEDLTQRHLVVANADGSGQRTIGDSVFFQIYSSGFSWSPDGSKIAYTTVVDPAQRPWRAKLRVVGVADGSEVALAEERLGYLPAWSPDGKRISFGAFVGELDADGKGEAELFLMDSDGSNVRQITDRPGTDLPPSWSPDSSRIVWSGTTVPSDPSQTATTVLFMMDVASAQITELGEGSDPVWSPDGQHIAFVLAEKPPPGVVRMRSNLDIYTLNVETGELRQLTQDRASDEWPTWSPDGQRIAFVSTRDSAQGEIYVMNADGSGIRRLTENDLAEAMLAWAPR